MGREGEELFEEVGFQVEFWLHARAAEQFFNRRAEEGWVIASVESDRAVLRFTQTPSKARCRIELFAPPWIKGWQVREAAESAFIKTREDAGWKYLGEHQNCYIFVDATGEAVELEDEPDAEARALKRLRWRRPPLTLYQLLVTVFWTWRSYDLFFENPGWALRGGLIVSAAAFGLLLIGLFFYQVAALLSRSHHAATVARTARGPSPELDAYKAVFSRGCGYRRRYVVTILVVLVVGVLALVSSLLLDRDSIQPLGAPPYTVASVYGIDAGEIEQEPTPHSLFVPDQWEYTSENGGNRIECRVYDSRWEWVAEYVYDDLTRYADRPLDEAVLRDLALDEGDADEQYGNELRLVYRDGVRCVWITAAKEPFEPGSPLYEAVKNREKDVP